MKGWWLLQGGIAALIHFHLMPNSVQTCKKFVSFRDPSLEFIIISAKYPTKNQQFRHFTQIDDWFLLQNCQNTLYFIILSTKEVLFLLKTSILLQLWKKFPQLYRNFRDPGSRGSRIFPCLCVPVSSSLPGNYSKDHETSSAVSNNLDMWNSQNLLYQ